MLKLSRELLSTSEDLVFGASKHGSIVRSRGIFLSYSVACSIRTRHDTTAPLMSGSSPAAVDSFKIGEMKPDNCWKPTVWRSVEAADRWPTGMSVMKRTGKESVPGQSSSDQGAAAPL